MKYQHLNLVEREKIFCLKEQGYSLRDIAKRLNRNVGTVSRELKRNKTGQGKYSREYLSFNYLPCKAQEKADKKALRQRTKAPLKNPLVYCYVRQHLRVGWTPDEIDGRLPIDHPGYSVSYETIYRYIYSSKMKRYHYWQYLTLSRKKRMKKGGRSVHRNGKIPGSISIDLRPKIVTTRVRIGDWETDNMEGKKTDLSVVSATVERLARLTLLDKLPDRLAQTKTRTVTLRLLKYPKSARQTLTADNGKENSYHRQIKEAVGLDVFFCHAYHSWEKGTVENTIGRIRRFIPKGQSIDNLTDTQIKEVERKLNSTPRKCLEYLTPYEKMDQIIPAPLIESVALPL